VRLVLLGDPVEHSRSPAIHNAALAAAGIEGRYTARRVGEQGVYLACSEIRAGSLDGANVTMPHKRVAAVAADRLSPAAERSRAVNTLLLEGGEVVGENTDVGGVLRAWEKAGLPHDAPVLVLGGGGAAAATLVALEGADLSVATVPAGDGAALAEMVGIEAPEVAWGRVIDGAVVVNATPLGMAGERLPAGVVEAAAGLLDFPYGAETTNAVKTAQKLGIPAADGIDILVAQASLSFSLWTGVGAPVEVMELAARA
jgi:shikimate dehydrogenase